MKEVPTGLCGRQGVSKPHIDNSNLLISSSSFANGLITINYSLGCSAAQRHYFDSKIERNIGV